MGICCSNRPTRDDLMDEIRRDARISDYEIGRASCRERV